VTELLAASTMVTDAELRHEFGPSVLTMKRSAWEFATSVPLELVRVQLRSGRSREYVLKHLAPGELSTKARRVRPPFVIEPRREIEMYRLVLDPAGVGPRLVRARCVPEAGIYWVLIERVKGSPLVEIGEPETWQAVARWLGTFHDRYVRGVAPSVREQARLIEYDGDWYRVWLDRARRFFATEDPPRSRRTRVGLRWLVDRYDRVIERLLALPRTLLHGECYPSNVVVSGRGRSTRVYPLDWEMAAIGPGVVDLAALTSGNWTPAARQSFGAAYLDGHPMSGLSLPELTDALGYARIHLAVQWLGWFGRRAAGPGHGRDWLNDALDDAESLRL
jgi:hypothetical protein